MGPSIVSLTTSVGVTGFRAHGIVGNSTLVHYLRANKPRPINPQNRTQGTQAPNILYPVLKFLTSHINYIILKNKSDDIYICIYIYTLIDPAPLSPRSLFLRLLTKKKRRLARNNPKQSEKLGKNNFRIFRIGSDSFGLLRMGFIFLIFRIVSDCFENCFSKGFGL